MNKSNLKIGKQYSNQELMNIFKCGNSGGMRRSHRTNTLVLIFDHNKICNKLVRWDTADASHKPVFANKSIARANDVKRPQI